MDEPTAAADAAAEEQVWTLQDFFQDTPAEASELQPSQRTSKAAGNSGNSGTNNSNDRSSFKEWAHRKEWEQQQVAKQQAKKRQALQDLQRRKQQQQQAGDSSSGSGGGGGATGDMPYAYDMSRWQVRSSEWRQGAPAK
jgi:hypothetical protein